MRSSLLLKNRGWTGSAVLLGTLVLTAGSLVAWKHASVRKADAAAARQPEPIESVTLAVAKQRQYRPTTTSVDTGAVWRPPGSPIRWARAGGRLPHRLCGPRRVSTPPGCPR